MGWLFRGGAAAERARRVEVRLGELLEGQARLFAAVSAAQATEHELRARIAQLETELTEERRRGADLADQMHHLIDELGASRKLWHSCREKAEASDRLLQEQARDA